MSSATAIEGCVSLSWIATFSAQRAPVVAVVPEAADDVGDRAGDQKVLLDEAQRAPLVGGIVGIEHPRQRFGGERIDHRAHEVALAELAKIEVVGGGRRPQAQRVDVAPAVSHNRAVVGNAAQRRAEAGRRFQRAVDQLELAPEVHVDGLVEPLDLPRIVEHQPVVGLFVLPAVLEALLEHAELVTQAVADGRQLHRRQRVHEARGQAAEAAVPEASVGFFFEQADPIEIVVLHGLGDQRVEQQIGDVVGQRLADEILHRQVVDALGIGLGVMPPGRHPSLREDVAHRARQRFEAFARVGGGRIDGVIEEQMPFEQRVGGAREMEGRAVVDREQVGLPVGFQAHPSYHTPRGWRIVFTGPFGGRFEERESREIRT